MSISQHDAVLWAHFLHGLAPLEDVHHVVGGVLLQLDDDLMTISVQMVTGAVLVGRGVFCRDRWQRFPLEATGRPIPLELLDWLAANPVVTIAD